MKKLSSITVALVLLGSSVAMADEKVKLNANGTLVFKKNPPSVDDIGEIFTKGIFYGRFRLNTFKWDWDVEGKKTKDNWSIGIGGSLLYKTAEFKGFSAMVGAYTSQSPWHMDRDEVKFLKAGKNTTSRLKVSRSGDWGITVLAQSYLQYKISKTIFRAGRQIFESYLTKSNDTKMIPNTFEGYTIVSKDLPKTTLKVAYLTSQKLRDHTSFHDVITFKDADGVKWANNDDSAINKSITYQKLENANMDVDHALLVLEAINKSIKNLKLKANYTAVPDIVSSATIEGSYTLKAGKFKVIPAFRYMRQFDDIGGKLGEVANLKGKSIGYKDPNSLDSYLYAFKVDFKTPYAWKLRLGYSKVADEADILAPWRGFPTGGFTRAMAQYNWYANTKTYMARVDYDFNKAGLVPGLKGMVRYAIQDFDDSKPGVQADSRVWHIDFIKSFMSLPNLEARVRIGLIDGDSNTIAQDGTKKADPSYNEYRFELNYLY